MDDFFMGYATLETALVGQWIDTKEARLQGNATVAIVDTIDADGSFLIHHFLDNQLKSPNAVVLVAFSQILNHYALIARKRGLNLTAYRDKGQFIFVDGLTCLLQKESATVDDTISSDIHTDPSLELMLNQISDALERTNASPLLIIDDLTLLLHSGYPLINIVLFLQQLKQALLKKQGSLLFVIHGDAVLIDEGSQWDVFVRTILREADVILRMEGLGSGASRDVHGQLHICRGSTNTDPSFKSSLLQYKVVDNGATFFAKGLGNGVI